MYLPRISETIFLGSGKPLFKKWSAKIGNAQITPLKQEIAMLDDKEVPQIIR